MKKRPPQKIVLARETLRKLDEAAVRSAAAGLTGTAGTCTVHCPSGVTCSLHPTACTSCTC